MGTLAKALSRCQALRVLGLRSCRLGSGGAALLAHWMSVFRALKELDVAENEIEAEAAQDLLAVVPFCSKLDYLNLSGNAFPAAPFGDPAGEGTVAAFWHNTVRRQCPAHVTVLGI